MYFVGRNGPLIMAVMWVETLIALAFVAARIYTRTRLIRNIFLEDHLITISMVLFFGYTILCTVATLNGMGSHAADLGLPQTVKAVKWEIAGQCFNIMAIATSKSSVAVFLIRIVNRKLHTWLLCFCIFSTTFVCVSCIVFMFTQCTPLESIFNPTIPHTCYINFTANAIFSGSYTTAMDFVLAIFPWFILWKLKMKRKERLTIAFGLSLGVFAGICGIVRAVELRGIAGKADYTYLTMPLILWGSTELLVCIMCASIPVLRPLYKKVRGTASSSVQYELGDARSRSLGTNTKGTTKSGYLTSSVSQRLSGAFGNQPNSTSSLRGSSTNIIMAGGQENLSDDNIMLRDIPGRLESGLGRGIQMTREVEISYK
ncbi:related to integral membrane protein pth11 [Phialocephala subalpina]|uniref:Related to integral membrane protein pth11 n=1 Tax=Phialocephala subalpina TaxID=576137 RepID=A0A1L7XX91_9HELO|nr:related to integral membrane protein pth11 [Phialocephala subalpina]